MKIIFETGMDGIIRGRDKHGNHVGEWDSAEWTEEEIQSMYADGPEPSE